MTDAAKVLPVLPADAALLRAVADWWWQPCVGGGPCVNNERRDVTHARLRALAEMLDKITPHVVRAVKRREEDLFDAADSMDASPGTNPEFIELRSARRALELLLTPEQRVALDAIAEAEP